METLFQKSEKIKKRYNRVSAIYDLMEAPMEKFTAKWRKDIASSYFWISMGIFSLRARVIILA